MEIVGTGMDESNGSGAEIKLNNKIQIFGNGNDVMGWEH